MGLQDLAQAIADEGWQKLREEIRGEPSETKLSKVRGHWNSHDKDWLSTVRVLNYSMAMRGDHSAGWNSLRQEASARYQKLRAERGSAKETRA